MMVVRSCIEIVEVKVLSMMNKKNVLVIGSGGREHSLGWKLSQSLSVDKIYFIPGNAGTSSVGENVEILPNNFDAIAAFVRKNKIELTIVGPEDPLVNGIVDHFEKEGLLIFGPSKYCAQLEGSKVFSKSFMNKYKIPTASHEVFTKDQEMELIEYLELSAFPIVLKADGLAAGKGVIIPTSLPEALAAVKVYFDDNTFGDAGSILVVEEFMDGEEASLFVLTDGKNYRLFPVAQDHKRIGDGDTGKNTGGMGAYAPAPIVSAELLKTIEKEIVVPSLEGMISEGHPYTGILYVGLMITSKGPKVVEYNVRFGDPECQVEMTLLESDLYSLFEEVAYKNLISELKLKNGFATSVVLASKGYPDSYEKGKLISFSKPDSENKFIFHAGTKLLNENIITNGGRVINVVGVGSTLHKSLDAAYDHVKSVTFDGMTYRTDIGKKGLTQKN